MSYYFSSHVYILIFPKEVKVSIASKKKLTWWQALISIIIILIAFAFGLWLAGLIPS